MTRLEGKDALVCHQVCWQERLVGALLAHFCSQKSRWSCALSNIDRADVTSAINTHCVYPELGWKQGQIPITGPGAPAMQFACSFSPSRCPVSRSCVWVRFSGYGTGYVDRNIFYHFLHVYVTILRIFITRALRRARGAPRSFVHVYVRIYVFVPSVYFSSHWQVCIHTFNHMHH